MRSYKISGLVYLLLLLVSFSACKKVIKVNLNATSPRYVVQGNIDNQAGPYSVTITRSVNFDQDNVFPAVSGAIVVVTDVTANQVDTLTEATPGSYNTHIITGIPGHTYALYINAAGNTFTASSTMPQVVTLDSLYTQPSAFGGSHPELVPVYTDPVALGNYYQFVQVKNDTVTDNINIRNDMLINGQMIKQPIRGNDLNPGDSVAVYLECIDSAMYQYYYSLAQTENQNSATPANPLSNIKGGALGYFSAHTYSMKSVIVQ